MTDPFWTSYWSLLLLFCLVKTYQRWQTQTEFKHIRLFSTCRWGIDCLNYDWICQRVAGGSSKDPDVFICHLGSWGRSSSTHCHCVLISNIDSKEVEVTALESEHTFAAELMFHLRIVANCRHQESKIVALGRVCSVRNSGWNFMRSMKLALFEWKWKQSTSIQRRSRRAS